MKVSDQQIIKGNNVKKLFKLISETKDMSRTKLARLTNLSKTTVSSLVDELILNGFVTDTGAIDTSRQGRKPNKLIVNSCNKFVCVFNWLIGEIEVQIIGLDGSCIYSKNKKYDNDIDYVKKTKEIYLEAENQLSKKKKILGICIISPSTIQPKNGKIVSTILTIPEDQTVIKNLREEIYNIPIAFFNDTSCFAYAETLYTSEMQDSSVLFLNLNKGIGAVLISQGEMLGGANGNLTEFGHFSVKRDGERCSCGNVGCLENYAGEGALCKRAEEFGITNTEKDKITYKSLAENVYKKEKGYAKLYEAISDDLAYGIGNLITVHNLKHVVIGGKGQFLGKDFLEILKKNLNNYGFQGFVSGVQLHYSKQNPEEKREFAGAAKYFLDKHFSFVSGIENEIFIG